ncbi:hypothetical protein INT43_006188 [Umbelopsis isabellina]|uniref:HTH araC/xylS-type domain-containing protein n=1 Tax=Mortierella isabellina TaxID=91625 RepID=A0A8H7Q0M1_MORIS|nr:hypothetical protein INT43_006188 [Umbelopsis isabellina]
MKELLLEEDTFERALDAYQVVYAAYDSNQLRIARQRRKLVAQIADQSAFVRRIEDWLNSGDYQSILDYGPPSQALPEAAISGYNTFDGDFESNEQIFDGVSDMKLFVDQMMPAWSGSSEFTGSEADASLDTSVDASFDTSLTEPSPITDMLPDSIYDNDEKRWTAVLNHDMDANGQFVYCVLTTGIYCRPSCASRRPRRSNVSFHNTNQDAEKAGFRPCKRCKPQELACPSDMRQMIAVGVVQQEIQLAAQKGRKQPPLSKLAAQAGMSSFHFHRVFKARTGFTPDEYGKRVRAQYQFSKH